MGSRQASNRHCAADFMVTRNADYFASLPDEKVIEELLRLDIGERFDGDREALSLIYAGTKESLDKARRIVIATNPHRHSVVFAPGPDEPAIPKPSAQANEELDKFLTSWIGINPPVALDSAVPRTTSVDGVPQTPKTPGGQSNSSEAD